MKRAAKLFIIVAASLIVGAQLGCGGTSQSNQPAGAAPNASPSPKVTATDSNSKPEPDTTQGGQAASGQMGSMEVSSTPAGASVILVPDLGDAAGIPETKGSTPAMITGLAPGKYTVEIEKPGYKSYQKEVEVKQGQSVKVAGRLSKG